MQTPHARLLLLSSVVIFGALGCKPEPKPECTTAADCSGASACVEVACQDGACVKTNKPVGTALADPTPGDCKTEVCDSNGEVKVAPLDTDLPDDNAECTENLCSNGVPTFPAKPVDTACGQGGQLRCNATGACVSCTDAAQCPTGTACQTPSCVAGTCGFDNVAQGTRVGTQTDGDCKVTQCDGAGAVETVNDNSDVPVDATTCTSNVCTDGVPSNPPVTASTSCSEGTGTTCNGSGQCVECVVAADCPGFDTECNVRTCNAGVCGRSYPADGTLVTSQTNFDCKKVVCDGAGRTVTRNDDADLPNDNNACTADVCTAGTPSHTNLGTGTACGTALVCDGAGACVGCNTASDCPGTDGVCGSRTCTNHVCGRNDVAANTLASSQTANDCKKVVCDGSGNAVTQNDDADLPVDDNNACTSQSCVNGVPTFPAVAVNTACSQNGGSFCSAAGQCVQCNQASQCAGTDTECSTRTCTAGVCGRVGTPAGTVLTAQTAGDCKQSQCVGDGGVQQVNFNSDIPADDGNPCTSQSCNAGTPAFPPVAINTACNGTSFCNATGTCVQCNTATQCPGTDTECQARTCSGSGTCGVSFTSSGFVVNAQTAGDCKQNQCNGSGSVVAVNFNTDVPAEDGNECTQQTCTNGTPTFPAVTQGAQCTVGGSVCNGTQCVACNVAADCPGTDTECAVKTCTNHVCGVNNLPNTTVLTQTAGDCQQRQCNGSGAVVSVANDADVPANDGNSCTGEICTAGVPSHPNLAINTACNGSSFCDGNGACVQCNAPTQCPGTDNECGTRTCNSNSCGMNFVASGTAVTSQTGGDCKENQCNGTGSIVSVNVDDLPADDGNECTAEACLNGTPTHPNRVAGFACTTNGGTICDGAGACVTCTQDSQCPAGNACSTARCNSGVCGFDYAAPGTVLSSQTTGDCQQAQCGTNGAIVSVADNADVPASDGNDCTVEQCNAGVPSSPFAPTNTACGTNGTRFCSPTGTCVECNAATQCTGTDTECQARTCSSNLCGMSYQPSGTALASQTAGNCSKAVCDGSGGTTTQTDAIDVPVDGNDCTDDICTGNVPSNPNKALNATCASNGGTYCNGTGTCVQCNAAGQCGTDNACTTYSCAANFCGSTSQPQGTVIATQTTGDCKQSQCAVDGGIAVVNDDSDVLVDNNPCTSDLCSSGVASNPLLAAGTTCSVNGGDSCNMDGGCVLAPTISSALPPDGGTFSMSPNIVVVFSKAMLSSSVTVQSLGGACSGSLQVSQDNFTSCIGLTTPTWNGAFTMVTVTPSVGLAYGGTFKVKVTTGVREQTGAPLKTEFVQSPGFTTPIDTTTAPGANSVVISQMFTFGGGSTAGTSYTTDLIELHNRSNSNTDISNWSLQYASATGAGWNTTKFNIPPGTTLAAGQYFLISTGTPGTVGAVISNVDFDAGTVIGLSNSAGKLALVNSDAGLPANTCNFGNSTVVDLVGYGSQSGTTGCWEQVDAGTSAAAAPGSAFSLQRRYDGCQDTNNNGADLEVLATAPRNRSSPAVVCGAVYNERNVPLEVDYCNVQFPVSISVSRTGGTMPTIYARIYESGVTEAAGAPSSAVYAQIGYGPATSNPQWQSGWTWVNATWNVQVVNDDEYKADLTMPTAGTYLYGARFSFDGLNWTYCDLNGAGSNGGLSFETSQLPVMTITP